MKPGRELDALIAEKVFGITKAIGGCWCTLRETCFMCEFPLPYSTDIAAAWEVVEKLYDTGIVTIKGTNKRPSPGATWLPSWFVTYTGEGISHAVHSTTAPHGICLLALKVVGTDEQKTSTNPPGACF